jgi:hypothetical protein
MDKWTGLCRHGLASGAEPGSGASTGCISRPTRAHLNSSWFSNRRRESLTAKADYDALAVGLFKRRTGADELLRAHLERLGVSPFWLRSALDAIRYCEQGEYFQPVFSVAGPAPARSVIALLRLEPYVQGEIDWNVSPSESPFWVGSVGDLRDELFEETAERFVGLYWSDQNPAVAPAFDGALRSMVAAVEESLTEVGEGPLEG